REPDVRHTAGAEPAHQAVPPADLLSLFQPHPPVSASITFVAIGPATWPPKHPVQRSSMTATATCGSSAGANPMNHGRLIRCSTSISAVPVLPASWPALVRRPLAVPSFATLTIIWVTASAVS